jgi:cysteine dioxygenase
LSLDLLLDELDEYMDHIPLALLTGRIGAAPLDWPSLEKHAQFSAERYRRNLVRAGPAYHALLLCWRNGQRSPIHDHRGSSCAVKVLRGEAIETLFERTAAGHIYAVRSQTLGEGSVVGSQDSDIHQISNLQPSGRDLVTLHIYSPPLLAMGQYSLTDTRVERFVDEVWAFSEGSGI